MLEAKGLRKTFHAGTSNERVALDGVSLALKPGDPVFALIKTVALDERSIAGGTSG